MIEGLVFGDPEVQALFQDDILDTPEDDLDVPWWRQDPLIAMAEQNEAFGPADENGTRRRRRAFVVHSVSRERMARTEEALELGYFVDRVERADIIRAFGGVCVYCGSGDDLVLDHVHPIARGGRHARDNLAPACVGCNQRKRAKTLERWMAEHGDRFAAEVAARLKAGWETSGWSRGKARAFQ